jgi:hypothetical protein
VAKAAAVVPIPGLKEPVLGLKELVVLVAAAADAPASSSISDKITDPSGKCIPNKSKRGNKGISYNQKKSVYHLTAEKFNLAVDSSSTLWVPLPLRQL